MRFEVIKTITTGNTVLRGMMSCCLIEVYFVFGAKYCKENTVPIGSLTRLCLEPCHILNSLLPQLVARLYGLLFNPQRLERMHTSETSVNFHRTTRRTVRSEFVHTECGK
jgi:hypothetical protein